MPNILTYIIYGILGLSFLVIVHELGHFLVAKLTNVKVLVFSVGFGKKLLRFMKGETEYAISAVPLGGYVKLLGESDEDDVKEEEKHRSFANKPPWVRLLIAFMGPLFNILFAFFLFYIIAISGYSVHSNKVGGVMEDSPAYAAGIREGDTILAIDERKINEFADILGAVKDAGTGPLKVRILRGGEEKVVQIVPKEIVEKDIFGDPVRLRIIGVRASEEFVKKRESLYDAVTISFQQTYFYVKITVVGIVKLITGAISPKNIGGPLLIFKEAGTRAKTGFNNFIFFIGLISINLGIINLLPIPILDGGHILFNIVELITRKKISPKAIEIAQKVGLVILILIMVFAFYNDIDRMFGISKIFNVK